MSTHIERTFESSRNPGIIPCTVSRLTDISPTVKHLLLTSSNNIPFLPGQWVDLFIPGTDLIGGYSICSAPGPSSETGSLGLAIKRANHPPALWVHEKCREGAVVGVRVGGDVFLDLETCSAKVVVLIAGGIGINPVLSMMRAGAGTNVKFHLLYSASSVDELIFREEIEQLCLKNENLKSQYFLSQDYPDWLEEENGSIRKGRMTPEYVNGILKGYSAKYSDKGDIRCFVCGPPPMIDFFSDKLDIKCEYEKWW